MATLELVRYEPFTSSINPEGVEWARTSAGSVIERLAQIFWKDGSPWQEANQWLFHRATSQEVEPGTVATDAKAIKRYASWLEENDVGWLEFPQQRRDRCLNRFRSSLLQDRDQGSIATNTIAVRMRAVVAMYRWLLESRLINPPREMWSERTSQVAIPGEFGIRRTVTVLTTSLAIRNRKSENDDLEDGVMPVSCEARDRIILFAKHHGPVELYLKLVLGFFSGMRVGTICDLKVATLRAATRDPHDPQWVRIKVGPAARPSVNTKFGVTGTILLYGPIHELLLEYACSPRHLKRQARALLPCRDLLFLTAAGRSYGESEKNGSGAVNTAMSRLRQKAISHNECSLESFYFHQTRATFATELTRVLLAHDPVKAVPFVKRYLMHRDVATTLKYVHFLEQEPLKNLAAREFAAEFLGVAAMADGEDEQ